MVRFLVDANVLIQVFRGDHDLSSLIESAGCAVDTTIYVALIQGAKNKIEVARIEKTLREIPFIALDSRISKRTIELIRLYSKSHGLLVADAMIAATCMEKNLGLITFNVKDFRFITGLRLEIPKL